MNKEEFRQWIYDNFNVGDNYTIAPAMLDGILDYAEKMAVEEGQEKSRDFLHLMLPALTDEEIELVKFC